MNPLCKISVDNRIVKAFKVLVPSMFFYMCIAVSKALLKLRIGVKVCQCHDAKTPVLLKKFGKFHHTGVSKLNF